MKDTTYRWTFRKDLYLKEREIPESKFLWVDELNGKSFISEFGSGCICRIENGRSHVIMSDWCDVEEVAE